MCKGLFASISLYGSKREMPPLAVNPDEAAVICEHLINGVTRQAVLRGEVRPLVAVRVKAVEPAVAPEIDSARSILGYRAHRVARQLPIFVRVIEKRWVVGHRLSGYRHAVVAQANPQPTAAVNKKRPRVGFG